jgi:hypothetical protein
MRKSAYLLALALGLALGAGVDHLVGSAIAAQAYQGANVTTATGILPANHGGTGIANNVAATTTRSGSHALTITTTGTTGITLPTSGTLYAVGGALGTPSSGTLTNATGLPISTGVSGLGTGVATFLATPTSANLAAAVTNETGSGALVFGTSPTLSGAPIFNGVGPVLLNNSADNNALNWVGSTGTNNSYLGITAAANYVSDAAAGDFFIGSDTKSVRLSAGVSRGSSQLTVNAANVTFTQPIIMSGTSMTVRSPRFVATGGTAPTCTTNCGTSPSVVGNDSGFTVTMGGTGSPASGWVITFNNTWSAAPACTVQMALTGMVVGKMVLTAVTTTTTLTAVTNGTAPANSDKYHVVCIGT